MTPLPKKVLSACQAAVLLWANWRHGLRAVLGLAVCVVRILLRRPAEDCKGAEFFEGFVTHARDHEGSHSFKYEVRMALIDLDAPPPWWAAEPVSRLSADTAREAAGTKGRVTLLTTPSSFGYEQNPIQIYYCADEDGKCRKGVCEVTNTPWNHRVNFAFELEGSELPKPLHVSPLMDLLDQRWQIKASAPRPGEGLEVQVDVLSKATQPEEGASPKSRKEEEQKQKPLLRARLLLEPSPWRHARAEQASSLAALRRFALQPHRTAVRIYYNAVLLLRKGVAFRKHPAPEYKGKVLEASAAQAQKAEEDQERLKRSSSGGMCPAAALGRGAQFGAAGNPWWSDNESFPWGSAYTRRAKSA